MCGSFFQKIFGNSQPDPPPVPVAPTPPPAPAPSQTQGPDRPAAPTPGPSQEDESKRKAKTSSKKVERKKRSAGTTQLQTPKPDQGGVKGTNTSQGVNTSGGTTSYKDPNTPNHPAAAPPRDTSGRKHYKK